MINLLGDYDSALAAMADVEGELWLTYERDRFDVDTPCSVVRAMAILDGAKRHRNSDLPVATINGGGGYNRYFVFPDGRVVFSRRHAISRASIERANDAGIDVV